MLKLSTPDCDPSPASYDLTTGPERDTPVSDYPHVYETPQCGFYAIVRGVKGPIHLHPQGAASWREAELNRQGYGLSEAC